MLPNILDVAQEYNITFNSNTYGKKETLAKCPFCKEDTKPEKRKTYYLSLNTIDQVYKCWFCGEAGGVLQFEAKLSNLSFIEVREKYFGTKKKDLHPAFKLTPDQLNEIGWLSLKQKDFKGFQKRREEVLRDWKSYVYHELAKHFALFMCIAHLENQEDKRKESHVWFIRKCRKHPIPKMYELIQNEYLKPEHQRQKWAKRGTDIARMAWKTSVKTNDIHLDDLFVNVLFIDYFLRKQIKKDTINSN